MHHLFPGTLQERKFASESATAEKERAFKCYH